MITKREVNFADRETVVRFLNDEEEGLLSQGQDTKVYGLDDKGNLVIKQDKTKEMRHRQQVEFLRNTGLTDDEIRKFLALK